MNFSYSIQQKTKVAFLLFCIMCSIILIRILEDNNIAKIDASFESLYQDRLVPATDLFHIAEKIYAKKHLLESGQKTLQFYQKLDCEIDLLITKYQKTFLIEKEQNSLQQLKSLIIQSRALELNYLVSANHIDATKNSINSIYSKILWQLGDLTSIQTNVGKELISSSKSIMDGSKFYSFIQFGLAIFIGTLVVSLITAANVVNIRREKFNLN